MKAIVIGCPGSGKSHFSRRLSAIMGVPLTHLDLLYWHEDFSHEETDVFIALQLAAMQGDSWIIDGNFGSTMDLRMERCDTVFFLDYPVDLCLSSAAARRGTKRSDLPWIEPSDDAEEFMEYIRTFPVQRRPHILEQIRLHPEKRVFVFTTRDEADAFLSALENKLQ